MDTSEVLYMTESILDDVKTAVLATTDKDGCPHMRWMTPTFLRGHDGVLFAVTSPHFRKVIELQAEPKVEWMVQTASLDKIINLKGYVNILDNPAIKNEVMETVGRKLRTFWKYNADTTDFVVLETMLEQATVMFPTKGIKVSVQFE